MPAALEDLYEDMSNSVTRGVQSLIASARMRAPSKTDMAPIVQALSAKHFRPVVSMNVPGFQAFYSKSNPNDIVIISTAFDQAVQGKLNRDGTTQLVSEVLPIYQLIDSL